MTLNPVYHSCLYCNFYRGGAGNGGGLRGEEGTVTGKTCPKGLYGIFCTVCM